MESIPKQRGMVPESKDKEEVRMQLKENLITIQLVTLWIQKFTLQLKLLVAELIDNGMVTKKFERIDKIRQSCVIIVLLIVKLIVRKLL